MTWQEIKDLEVWETRGVVSSPHPPNFSRLGKKLIWYSVGGRNLLSDEILKFSYLFFCWALPAVLWWKLIQPLYNSILSNARFDFSAFPLKVVIIAFARMCNIQSTHYAKLSSNNYFSSASFWWLFFCKLNTIWVHTQLPNRTEYGHGHFITLY